MMNMDPPPNHFGFLVKFKAYEFYVITGVLAEVSLTVGP